MVSLNRFGRFTLSLISSSVSALAFSQAYSMEVIPGSPYLDGSTAYGLGNNGYVVAQTGIYHQGVVTSPPSVNGKNFDVESVNGSGQAVGAYNTGVFSKFGDYYQAVRFDGTNSSVLNVGGTSNDASYLGDDGTILGTVITYPNDVTVGRGYVIRNGVQTMLATTGAPYATTSAADVNASGVVVGTTDGPNGNYNFHAARWANNHLQDLGTGSPNYKQSAAMGISDAGDVLVESYRDYFEGDGVGQGFIWSNGALTPLPTFGGALASGSSINSKGQVVGFAQDAGGTYHPFLWDKTHGMTSLENVLAGTGYYDFSPSAINDQGQILGNALIRRPEGYSVSWAVLLTPRAVPVPEPASVCGLGFGALALLRRRRRG